MKSNRLQLSVNPNPNSNRSKLCLIISVVSIFESDQITISTSLYIEKNYAHKYNGNSWIIIDNKLLIFGRKTIIIITTKTKLLILKREKIKQRKRDLIYNYSLLLLLNERTIERIEEFERNKKLDRFNIIQSGSINNERREKITFLVKEERNERTKNLKREYYIDNKSE